MNEVSKAIYRASGMIAAAQKIDLRANEFRTGAVTLKRQRLAIAAVLSSEADKLRDLAVKTRADAERSVNSSRAPSENENG